MPRIKENRICLVCKKDFLKPSHLKKHMYIQNTYCKAHLELQKQFTNEYEQKFKVLDQTYLEKNESLEAERT
eukprot:Pgem_evm1s19817